MNVIAKQLTSGCRPWLKNVACLKHTGALWQTRSSILCDLSDQVDFMETAVGS